MEKVTDVYVAKQNRQNRSTRRQVRNYATKCSRAQHSILPLCPSSDTVYRPDVG